MPCGSHNPHRAVFPLQCTQPGEPRRHGILPYEEFGYTVDRSVCVGLAFSKYNVSSVSVNQDALSSGPHPTILLQLCTLPIDNYYADDIAKREILFPTLLASCYGHPHNLRYIHISE